MTFLWICVGVVLGIIIGAVIATSLLIGELTKAIGIDKWIK